jgi:CDP-diacylglycerol--glycerol-3-phosphate 3-phosphatidyltransferase
MCVTDFGEWILPDFVPVLIESVNHLQDVIRGARVAKRSIRQAVAQAIRPQDKDQNQSQQQLYLFQVLSSPLATLLPNPLNEVAGVFHIKLYIVDDSLILSGANLSEEYFVDRHDRYLWICQGGNGLVDFYAQVLQVLCRHSKAYNNDDGGAAKTSTDFTTPTSREEFLQQITKLFQDLEPESAKDLLSDPDTVAVCVPTFHAPQGFWPQPPTPNFVSDVEATQALLEEGQKYDDDGDDDTSVQLSSAYLNPTSDLIKALALYPPLTAGRLSHGFRPKKNKAGNKGKDWIPTVFDHLQRDTCLKLPHAQIHHWQREDWTFHAKGLWIQQQQNLLAAIVGSSNFGGRSFVRDMESNLVLVFPPSNSGNNVVMAESLQDEWKQLLASSKPVDTKGLVESAPPLPIHIRSLYPYIKSFF